MDSPPTGGEANSSHGLSRTQEPHSALGLAHERWNLNAVGLPAQVIDNIQSARAASTRSLYSGKWQVFEEWCDSRCSTPFQCSVVDLRVLSTRLSR